MIELGVKAKDKITGFEGVVTARVSYLYGCDQYCLVPTVNEKGEVREREYFDEGRLEVMGRGVLPEEVKADKNGGDQRDCPR